MWRLLCSLFQPNHGHEPMLDVVSMMSILYCMIPPMAPLRSSSDLISDTDGVYTIYKIIKRFESVSSSPGLVAGLYCSFRL